MQHAWKISSSNALKIEVPLHGTATSMPCLLAFKSAFYLIQVCVSPVHTVRIQSQIRDEHPSTGFVWFDSKISLQFKLIIDFGLKQFKSAHVVQQCLKTYHHHPQKTPKPTPKQKTLEEISQLLLVVLQLETL